MSKKNNTGGFSWNDIFSSYVDGAKPGITKTEQLPSTLDEMEIGDPSPVISDDMVVVNQLENDNLPPRVAKRKRERSVSKKKPRSRTVIMDSVDLSYEIDSALPVKGFEYTSQEEDDARYYRKLAKIGKTSQHHISLLPDQAEPLRYIESLQPEQKPIWFAQAFQRLSETNLKFPSQPMLSRKYLKNFLRQAKDGERECNHPNCTSVKMGGFRCRELIVPGIKHQPVIRGWCYLCHLAETNSLYCETQNLDFEDQVFVIHSFTVMTDSEGEYRLSQTIQGEDGTSGIFGPFPIFNVNNYAKVGNSWRESDSLVFHQPSKVLSPNESSLTTNRPVTGKC